MKTLLITALLISSTLGYAQDVPPTPGTSPMQENLPRDPQQEMQALSGSLKELHGQVHAQLGAIEKRAMGPTTERTSAMLARQRDELQQARAELESMLDEVATADIEDRENTITRATAVMEKVTETLARTKDTSTSAVN